MTEGERIWNGYSPAFRRQLAKAGYDAAVFMIDHIEHFSWKKWTDNYIREHLRCTTGLSFSNSPSPQLYKEIRRQHPELTKWFEGQGNESLI